MNFYPGDTIRVLTMDSESPYAVQTTTQKITVKRPDYIISRAILAEGSKMISFPFPLNPYEAATSGRVKLRTVVIERLHHRPWYNHLRAAWDSIW